MLSCMQHAAVSFPGATHTVCTHFPSTSLISTNCPCKGPCVNIDLNITIWASWKFCFELNRMIAYFMDNQTKVQYLPLNIFK